MKENPRGAKRIVHVCSGHTVDDARVFHRACVSLAEAGYDVHLIGQSEREGEYEEKGVTIHPLSPGVDRFTRIARRYRVAFLAAHLEPDLFHVHEPELLGPVLFLARSTPVIWDAHESYMDVVMDRAWIPTRLRKLVRVGWNVEEHRLVKRCAGIIAATDEVGERYRPLHTNCVTIKNVPKLSQMPVVPFALRAPEVCVFTGRIAANRGIGETIAAFRILASRGRRYKFIIAGECDEWYAKKTQDLIHELGLEEMVTMNGILTHAETLELSGHAALGLVPHLPYGNNLAAWPVKMMEYMALGLPVIYSDLPTHRDIAGARAIGAAVDARVPEEIADAVERLLSDRALLQRSGEEARRRALEALDWTAESVKLLTFYSGILGRAVESSARTSVSRQRSRASHSTERTLRNYSHTDSARAIPRARHASIRSE